MADSLRGAKQSAIVMDYLASLGELDIREAVDNNDLTRRMRAMPIEALAGMATPQVRPDVWHFSSLPEDVQRDILAHLDAQAREREENSKAIRPWDATLYSKAAGLQKAMVADGMVVDGADGTCHQNKWGKGLFNGKPGALNGHFWFEDGLLPDDAVVMPKIQGENQPFSLSWGFDFTEALPIPFAEEKRDQDKPFSAKNGNVIFDLHGVVVLLPLLAYLYILRMFPGVKFMAVADGKRSYEKPVAAVVDGEVKALVMPLRDVRYKGSADAVERYRHAAKTGVFLDELDQIPGDAPAESPSVPAPAVAPADTNSGLICASTDHLAPDDRAYPFQFPGDATFYDSETGEPLSDQQYEGLALVGRELALMVTWLEDGERAWGSIGASCPFQPDATYTAPSRSLAPVLHDAHVALCRMTPREYRRMVYDAAIAALENGQQVVMATQTKAWQLASHSIRFDDAQGVILHRLGKRWDAVEFQPLDSLASQLGLPTTFDHRRAIDALAPPEALPVEDEQPEAQLSEAEQDAMAAKARATVDHLVLQRAQWTTLDGVDVLQIPGSNYAAVPSTGRKDARRFTVFTMDEREEYCHLTRKEVYDWLYDVAKTELEEAEEFLASYTAPARSPSPDVPSFAEWVQHCKEMERQCTADMVTRYTEELRRLESGEPPATPMEATYWRNRDERIAELKEMIANAQTVREDRTDYAFFYQFHYGVAPDGPVLVLAPVPDSQATEEVATDGRELGGVAPDGQMLGGVASDAPKPDGLEPYPTVPYATAPETPEPDSQAADTPALSPPSRQPPTPQAIYTGRDRSPGRPCTILLRKLGLLARRQDRPPGRASPASCPSTPTHTAVARERPP